MLELSFDRFQTGSSFQNFVGNNSILQQKTHPPQLKSQEGRGFGFGGSLVWSHKNVCAGELTYGQVESQS